MAGWAAVEVAAVPHAAGTLPGHRRVPGEGSRALWNHPSWPQQPLYQAMDATVCGKGVSYFFCLSSPAAIPMRRSFPGNRSLWSLLMAEPKEITVV